MKDTTKLPNKDLFDRHIAMHFSHGKSKLEIKDGYLTSKKYDSIIKRLYKYKNGFIKSVKFDVYNDKEMLSLVMDVISRIDSNIVTCSRRLEDIETKNLPKLGYLPCMVSCPVIELRRLMNDHT